jgi:uncharacterized membrane protein (UPF0127 family)
MPRSDLTLLRAAVVALALGVAAACSGGGVSDYAGKSEAKAPKNENRLELVTETGVSTVNLELAATDEERALGLMYRESLAPDAGMLFDFGPEPRLVSMWMKNTLIPLDMAFIDENGVIVHTVANTTPRSLSPISSQGAVVAVLEMAGGRFAELGVKPGDKVRHAWFD